MSHTCNLLYKRSCTCGDKMDQITSKILHQLVLQPSVSFKKVWERSSSLPICIGLDRRMYFEYHSEGYYNDGYQGLPRRLFSLPREAGVKHWSGMLYFCHIRHKPTTPEETEVCLMILTSDGFIKILNSDTGEVLRSVYISTNIQFKHLSWAEYLESVQIKSTLTKNVGNPPTAGGGRLMSIMIFKIHPLDLIAYFHIKKEVFGDNIKDASVTDDLLLILTSQKCRYYSLQWILANCTIKTVHLNESDNNLGYIPGLYPNSIPVTVDITTPPPVLFETYCNPEVGVVFGGSPLVYVHNSKPSLLNEFHINLLETKELIATLTTDLVAFHQDVVDFHFEDYRRILHISGCTLRCYQLVSESSKLQLQFFVDFKELQNQMIDDSIPQISSRGRLIKRKKKDSSFFGDFVSAVQDVDYENEFDLLYAVVTLPEGEQTNAYFCFIDDKSGQITKTVPLPTWNFEAGNSVYYELDCIIHIASYHSKHVCHFYKLIRDH